jgi:Putative transposase
VSRRSSKKTRLTNACKGPWGLGNCTMRSVRNQRLYPKAGKRGRGHAVEFMGFNLHAAVRVAAGCPAERERLLRYCARAPLSLERLGILADGRITYRMQHGNKVRVMSPVQFLARLAALIPPPQHPLIRFCGVFAPHHSRRAWVTPTLAAAGATWPHEDASGPRGGHGGNLGEPEALERDNGGEADSPASGSHGNAAGCAVEQTGAPRLALSGLFRIDWATLLKRVYTVDALACTECGGRMRFTDVFEDKRAACEELTRRGLPCEAPPLARARAPDWEDA